MNINQLSKTTINHHEHYWAVLGPNLGIHYTHSKINKTTGISMRVPSRKYCRLVYRRGDTPLYKVKLS